MKAVQIIAPGSLEFRDVPSRALRSWEIRIAVAASCVCGSDLKNISHPVLLPQVPGHEFAGAVEEVSIEASARFRIGDRVTAFPMMACLKCDHCRDRRYRDCANKLSLGFQLPGSFAEEVIVDSRFAVPLTDNLTYEQGALVEHLCCGYRLGEEMRGHRLATDSHIAIIGDGPIALADLQALRRSGYRNMTLIGKHAPRMELARRLGASAVMNSSDVLHAVRAEDIGWIDACIMAAPADQTLDEVLPLLRTQSVVFPQTRITRDSTLRGLEARKATMGRAFAYALDDFGAVMRLIENGELETAPLITNRVDLASFAELFPALRNRDNVVKIAVINKDFAKP